MADQRPFILIVDDDRDFTQILVDKFYASGFEVATAENGKIACEKARNFKPALIIMDVKMPVMDGVAALMKMKEDPELKNMRVLLLTAFGERQQEIYQTDRRFAQEVGAVEYVLKDNNLDDIVKKAKSVLGIK